MGTWVWTASNTLCFLQQTALPSLRIRAKLHHGYALAMVTLPKRCCGSVLSPWLRINPPSAVWSQQICSLRNIFRCRLGVLTTCLCWLYWTQYSGWFHFKSLIGQRHVPTVLRSYTAWLLLLHCFFLFVVTTLKKTFQTLHMCLQSWFKMMNLRFLYVLTCDCDYFLWLLLRHCCCVVVQYV